MALTSYERISRTQSAVAYALAVAFTAIIILLLVLVTGYLLSIGFGSLSWSFFTEVPNGNMHGIVGGMKHALIGTVILIAAASAVGIPVGMLTGVYLSEYEAAS